MKCQEMAIQEPSLRLPKRLLGKKALHQGPQLGRSGQWCHDDCNCKMSQSPQDQHRSAEFCCSPKVASWTCPSSRDASRSEQLAPLSPCQVSPRSMLMLDALDPSKDESKETETSETSKQADEPQEPEEPKDKAKESEEADKTKESKEPKEADETKEPKEGKEADESKDSKDSKEIWGLAFWPLCLTSIWKWTWDILRFCCRCSEVMLPSEAHSDLRRNPRVKSRKRADTGLQRDGRRIFTFGEIWWVLSGCLWLTSGIPGS